MTADALLRRTPTVPLLNLVLQLPDLCEELREQMLWIQWGGCDPFKNPQDSKNKKGDDGSVRWFKDTLGKQDYCWNGEYRFWVWEFKSNPTRPVALRFFVSNIRGVSCEYNPKAGLLDIVPLWIATLTKLGYPWHEK